MLTMPAVDQAAIGDRERIAADLAQLVAPASVIAAPAALRAYESDGLTAYRQPPLVAVLPANTAEVAAVLRYCHQRKLKVVPRGSGTSLSGGALPLARRRSGRPRQAQSRPGDRLRQSLRHRAAGRAQPRHQPRGRGSRLLLRARSVEPDRLLDRRQRRGEFRRRALPEIRPHHQQPARPARWC